MDHDENLNYEENLSFLNECRMELGRRIVGQEEMIDSLLGALVSGGHVLLEGVPGLAKTRAVKALAELTGLAFKRIQFTPDLLPADLTGTMVWEQERSVFSVSKGPIFANLILADEINRAPAKVQSALLEAMEEKQVTIGRETYPLPSPFLVMATQNPIEQEGTYALPEAELDRFLIKIVIPYPNPEEEIKVLGFAENIAAGNQQETLKPLLDGQRLAALREAASAVKVDEAIKRYIVAVVSATRPPQTKQPAVRGQGWQQTKAAAGKAGEDARRGGRQDVYRYISFGASPRASLALYRCARIRSLFQGRAFVTPEDVKSAALPVLRHRIVLSYEAEADGLDADGLISRILSFVPVP
jgi:MoxR-like ATPase